MTEHELRAHSEERYAAIAEEQRAFARECRLRLDRLCERHVRAIDAMREQIRADTESTWRMLDRLDGGGATA